ncbi:hypothetical protein [Rhizobium etli]|uniref:hypothetical protein n=1 Tax=Rhizobium etli TaxID=29449 RepID=UPI001F2E3E2E|nr:hypothetical protein [Rhizobium etli]
MALVPNGGTFLKIVVIGGSGLIGSRPVTLLCEAGHEVVAASPSTGVNPFTGEGLSEALAGAQVVVDVRERRCRNAVRYSQYLKKNLGEFAAKVQTSRVEDVRSLIVRRSSGEKSRRILGWHPRAPEKTIIETARSLFRARRRKLAITSGRETF